MAGKNFDDTVVYNLLTSSPSPRPCYDQITYAPTGYPSPLVVGSDSRHIKATEIPTIVGYPKSESIKFTVTLSNSVNPSALSAKTYANKVSEFMIGHCDRTLILDPDYTYASGTVTVTR